MSRIKKIIWACDFNKASMDALIYANQLAKKFHAEIIGLNVVQVPVWNCYNIEEDYCRELIKSIEEMKRRRIARIERRFERISRAEEKNNIVFKYNIRTGKANEEISDYAKEEKAQLIVMGNKGNGRLEIGSTVFKVIKNSKLPAMIVKKVHRKGKIKRILLPVDLKDKWSNAFDIALEISDKYDADIYILHIIEIYNYEGIEEVQDKLLAYATKMIEESTNLMKKKAGKVRAYGYAQKAINASIGILDFINRYKIDLVVMGTHARTGIGKFFLGSVAEKVMVDSWRPIIVVPPENEG